MKKSICTGFMLCAFVLTSINCKAASSDPFIAEASEFRLIVEDLPYSLKSRGVTVNEIEQYVELCCRRSSLPIIDSSVHDCILWVQISALTIEAGKRELGLACSIEMRFYQTGKTKTTNQSTLVASWHALSRNILSTSRDLKGGIREGLRGQVEEFENVWLASHLKPKKYKIEPEH